MHHAAHCPQNANKLGGLEGFGDACPAPLESVSDSAQLATAYCSYRYVISCNITLRIFHAEFRNEKNSIEGPRSHVETAEMVRWFDEFWSSPDLAYLSFLQVSKCAHNADQITRSAQLYISLNPPSGSSSVAYLRD
jgi:hypothetical protein